MRAIEATGILDAQGHLQLDTPLPQGQPSRVRVIMLLPDALEPDSSELDEQQWLNAIATNPSFSFLEEPEEDIYTLDDGKPIDYAG